MGHDQRVPLIGIRDLLANIHQGAWENHRSDAEYMAAPDQMPEVTSPLSRGSHPYTVRGHHNPSLKFFADRLRKAGKPHKVIITAVARKLVTIANTLCKSRQKWTAATA